jgi:hypothetical protein
MKAPSPQLSGFRLLFTYLMLSGKFPPFEGFQFFLKLLSPFKGLPLLRGVLSAF